MPAPPVSGLGGLGGPKGGCGMRCGTRGCLAEFAGVVAAPDPAHPSRFYGHHMTGHDDGGGNGSATEQWESWLASWTFGSCDSFWRADFDQDQDVDAGDAATFAVFAEESNMAADLDESQTIAVPDLIMMLDAVGEAEP